MAKKYFNVDLETSGDVKCSTLDVTTIEGPVHFDGDVTGTTTFQPAIGFTIPDRLTTTTLLDHQPAVFSHKEKVSNLPLYKQLYCIDTIPATAHVALGTPESLAAYSYANIKLLASYDSSPSNDADAFYDPAIHLKVLSRSSDSVAAFSTIKLTNEDVVNTNTTTLEVRSNKVRVGGVMEITGACSAASFSPFSGEHIYPTNNSLNIGSAVVLEGGVLKHSSISNSTTCVGIVGRYFDTAPEEEQLSSLRQALTTSYAHVISVGDSRVTTCQGFNVCNENGDIQPGDLLVTSSTPGYLMKQDDDIMRSKTVGKAMEAVTFDDNGQSTGVYGFIYCG